MQQPLQKHEILTDPPEATVPNRETNEMRLLREGFQKTQQPQQAHIQFAFTGVRSAQSLLFTIKQNLARLIIIIN